MRKKLILNLMLCLTIISANADDLSNQMQQINNTPIRAENDMWQRMRDGFALDHRETKEVKYWEKRYGNPKYFTIIMQNAAPYLYFVVSEMERRGIPTELALIPIVESTYNPNAVSPAAISTGMWQFLNASGKRFGMTVNSDLDERKDIVKSTRGAIAYLQYLHDLFGSWELAIAAYNWGEGNINTAVNNASSHNFYDLEVRDITRQYVPKIIALANIIQNPSKFGIKMINLPNKPYFAIVNPSTPVSVNSFMTQANLSNEQNKKLNPQYNSLSYVVSPAGRLLLPVNNQATYLASSGGRPTGAILAMPNTASGIVSTQNVATSTPDNTTTAAADDGIVQLANADNAGTSAQAKPTTSPTTINDLLNDKSPPGGSLSVASNTSNSPEFSSYTVVAGDTLYSISRKFSIPLDSLRSDNQLGDNTVKLNQKLLIRNNSGNS